MRLIILLIGIYCVSNTDFGANSFWASTFFPVVDFVFIFYLLFDLLLFVWVLQHGDSLRTKRQAEDDVWYIFYNSIAPFVDSQRHFENAWYWLGIGIEVTLMLVAYVYTWGLLFDALMRTGW